MLHKGMFYITFHQVLHKRKFFELKSEAPPPPPPTHTHTPLLASSYTMKNKYLNGPKPNGREWPTLLFGAKLFPSLRAGVGGGGGGSLRRIQCQQNPILSLPYSIFVCQFKQYAGASA